MAFKGPLQVARIQDPRVLAGLARCMEEMPSRPLADVRRLLQEQGWNEVAAELGDVLTLDVHSQRSYRSYRSCVLLHRGLIQGSLARGFDSGPGMLAPSRKCMAYAYMA